jgi:hypothetical protein
MLLLHKVTKPFIPKLKGELGTIQEVRNSKNTTYQTVVICYLEPIFFLNYDDVTPLTLPLTFQSLQISVHNIHDFLMSEQY